MISEVFHALRGALISHIHLATGEGAAESIEDPVVFFRSDKLDSVDFKQGAVTMMLVNMEEDRSVLPPDPYRRTLADGTTLLVRPPVPLNLYILFVARFTNYLDSLRHLAFIVQFFQRYRSIDPQNMPALSPGIQRLVCEMVSIPMTQHNQVWAALNTAYQPSLLYKIKMVVFHDQDGVPAAAPGAPTLAPIQRLDP